MLCSLWLQEKENIPLSNFLNWPNLFIFLRKFLAKLVQNSRFFASTGISKNNENTGDEKENLLADLGISLGKKFMFLDFIENVL